MKKKAIDGKYNNKKIDRFEFFCKSVTALGLTIHFAIQLWKWWTSSKEAKTEEENEVIDEYSEVEDKEENIL